MVSREDIEGYLDRYADGNLEVREVEEGLWILSNAEGPEVVVTYAPPVVVFRVKVMEVPAASGARLALMTRLLEWNVTDLVHGSYGIEGDHVVLTDTLQLEDLGFNEFQASLDSIMLALASHVPALAAHGES